MALPSDEITGTDTDQDNPSSSNDELLMEQEEADDLDLSLAKMILEEEPSAEESNSTSSEEINETNLGPKRQDRLITRSVSFAPTVEEFEIPSRYDPSYISPCSPTDYLDALVDSYRLQSLIHLYPMYEEEKQPYVPKTRRTRLNPNWREHRIRRLMNKLEELSLWDREEELKVTQAQYLREQKLEQIQDRQRNQDLCLNLMRQRHESELESAVLLDQAATGINDECTSAAIARTVHLASPANSLSDYGLPTLPYALTRRVRQDQEKIPIYKTPIGQYRQFEATMNNKLEKINEKLRPDWRVMRAYGSYRTSIPPTVVPLFSETYTALLSLPETYSSNRYQQYHYGFDPYLHQPSKHASSPDYETRRRSHSNRDVRVPFKEDSSDDDASNCDNEDNHSQSRSNSLRRFINSSSNPTSSALVSTTRDYSFIHSPQPISNSIHKRSLNDDLNAITLFSGETNQTILRDITDSSNLISIKNRSSPVSTNKRLMFIEQDADNEENFNYNKSSRMSPYQRELLSLSFNR